MQPRQRRNHNSAGALVAAALTLVLVACASPLPYHARGRVVHSYPHASDAFTQGLALDDDVLIESTGLYGKSTLRRVDLETGEVLQLRPLPPDYFGEGCTVWGDEIIQLTWKAGIGFVYDKQSLAMKHRFTYTGEGWGLTHDGERLIMSDGTSYLRFLDPETFQEIGQVQVLDEGEPVKQLNELEWIMDQVWANVWQSSQIARIDVETGAVLGWIDLSDLATKEPRGVLNGIAAKGRSIFVTGKRWENVYQVEVISADASSIPSSLTRRLLNPQFVNEIPSNTTDTLVPGASQHLDRDGRAPIAQASQH